MGSTWRRTGGGSVWTGVCLLLVAGWGLAQSVQGGEGDVVDTNTNNEETIKNIRQKKPIMAGLQWDPNQNSAQSLGPNVMPNYGYSFYAKNAYNQPPGFMQQRPGNIQQAPSYISNAAPVYINDPPQATGGGEFVVNRHSAAFSNPGAGQSPADNQPDINGLILQAIQANMISSQALRQLALPEGFAERAAITAPTPPPVLSTDTPETTKPPPSINEIISNVSSSITNKEIKVTSRPQQEVTSRKPQEVTSPKQQHVTFSPKIPNITLQSFPVYSSTSVSTDAPSTDLPILPTVTMRVHKHQPGLKNSTVTLVIHRPLNRTRPASAPTTNRNQATAPTTANIPASSPTTAKNQALAPTTAKSPASVPTKPPSIHTTAQVNGNSSTPAAAGGESDHKNELDASRAPVIGTSIAPIISPLLTTTLKLFTTTTRRPAMMTPRPASQRPIVTAIIDDNNPPPRRTTTKKHTMVTARPMITLATVPQIGGTELDPNEIVILGYDGTKSVASKRPTTMRPRTTTNKFMTRRPILPVTPRPTAQTSTHEMIHQTIIPGNYVGLIGESMYSSDQIFNNDGINSPPSFFRPILNTPSSTTTSSSTTRQRVTSTEPSPPQPPASFPTRPSRRTTIPTLIFTRATPPTTEVPPITELPTRPVTSAPVFSNNRPSNNNQIFSPANNRPSGIRQLVFALGLALIPTAIIAFFSGVPALIFGRRKRDIEDLFESRIIGDVTSEIDGILNFIDRIEQLEDFGFDEVESLAMKKRQVNMNSLTSRLFEGIQKLRKNRHLEDLSTHLENIFKAINLNDFSDDEGHPRKKRESESLEEVESRTFPAQMSLQAQFLPSLQIQGQGLTGQLQGQPITGQMQGQGHGLQLQGQGSMDPSHLFRPNDRQNNNQGPGRVQGQFSLQGLYPPPAIHNRFDEFQELDGKNQFSENQQRKPFTRHERPVEDHKPFNNSEEIPGSNHHNIRHNTFSSQLAQSMPNPLTFPITQHFLQETSKVRKIKRRRYQQNRFIPYHMRRWRKNVIKAGRPQVVKNNPYTGIMRHKRDVSLNARGPLLIINPYQRPTYEPLNQQSFYANEPQSFYHNNPLIQGGHRVLHNSIGERSFQTTGPSYPSHQQLQGYLPTPHPYQTPLLPDPVYMRYLNLANKRKDPHHQKSQFSLSKPFRHLFAPRKRSGKSSSNYMKPVYVHGRNTKTLHRMRRDSDAEDGSRYRDYYPDERHYAREQQEQRPPYGPPAYHRQDQDSYEGSRGGGEPPYAYQEKQELPPNPYSYQEKPEPPPNPYSFQDKLEPPPFPYQDKSEPPPFPYQEKPEPPPFPYEKPKKYPYHPNSRFDRDPHILDPFSSVNKLDQTYFFNQFQRQQQLMGSQFPGGQQFPGQQQFAPSPHQFPLQQFPSQSFAGLGALGGGGGMGGGLGALGGGGGMGAGLTAAPMGHNPSPLGSIFGPQVPGQQWRPHSDPLLNYYMSMATKKKDVVGVNGMGTALPLSMMSFARGKKKKNRRKSREASHGYEQLVAGAQYPSHELVAEARQAPYQPLPQFQQPQKRRGSSHSVNPYLPKQGDPNYAQFRKMINRRKKSNQKKVKNAPNPSNHKKQPKRRIKHLKQLKPQNFQNPGIMNNKNRRHHTVSPGKLPTISGGGGKVRNSKNSNSKIYNYQSPVYVQPVQTQQYQNIRGKWVAAQQQQQQKGQGHPQAQNMVEIQYAPQPQTQMNQNYQQQAFNQAPNYNQQNQGNSQMYVNPPAFNQNSNQQYNSMFQGPSQSMFPGQQQSSSMFPGQQQALSMFPDQQQSSSMFQPNDFIPNFQYQNQITGDSSTGNGNDRIDDDTSGYHSNTAENYITQSSQWQPSTFATSSQSSWLSTEMNDQSSQSMESETQT